MLIDEIVSYCDKEYKKEDAIYPKCNVFLDENKIPLGECDKCLDKIHRHNTYNINKEKVERDYDCPKIINRYVCTFSYQYTSEICYALNKLKNLKEYKELNVLSLGCGACADLMALEKMLTGVRINYCGIDKNKLWKPVHEKIKNYCDNNCNIKVDLDCTKDVLKFVEERERKGFDIVIMSYFVSHFRITRQEKSIKNFYNNLYTNVIKQKNKNMPCFIIINDVNSCNCLRENIGKETIINILDTNKKSYTPIRKYFNYPTDKYIYPYGEAYNHNKTIKVPKHIQKYIHQGTCRSAQLLVEVE